MKFTIKRQPFANQLANILRAVSHTAPIEVLKGIKISCDDSGITLIGSDAEISIESFLPVSDPSLDIHIERSGSVVLPARLFNEVVRKLPTDKVSIDVNEANAATITSGTAVFVISGVDGDQYPRLPDVNLDHQISLPTIAFKNMITQTLFATSNQENRPILTGVHLIAGEGHIRGVATDSHRLSRRDIPMNFESSEQIFDDITIPKKTLNELVRIVGDDQELTMTVTDQQVIFKSENNTIYSRLIEGSYPETDRLLPQESSTEFVVDAQVFLAAIDRAALIANESINTTVHLDVSEDKVEVSVPGNEASFVSENIEYENVSGPQINISFNPDYMKEALNAFGATNIRLKFKSAVEPIFIVAEEESEIPHNELLQLLTPIRTHY